MNRFNESPWSKVQCEMILAFLSFANISFRLAVASLLEMGYQVLIIVIVYLKYLC